MHGAGVGHQHAGGELRVAFQRQRIFDDLGVPVRGVAAANDKTAVRHGRMITGQLCGSYEVHCGVVLVEVVRHAHDLGAHGVLGSAVLEHHKAFAGVLLAGGQFGARAAPDLFNGCFRRQRVLNAASNPVHAADGVRMSLAQSAAPERVGVAVGQQRLAVDAVDGEHARVPAGGDQGGLIVGLGRCVHGGEVLGNARVRVKAVDSIKQCRQRRALLRQVRL